MAEVKVTNISKETTERELVNLEGVTDVKMGKYITTQELLKIQVVGKHEKINPCSLGDIFEEFKANADSHGCYIVDDPWFANDKLAELLLENLRAQGYRIVKEE